MLPFLNAIRLGKCLRVHRFLEGLQTPCFPASQPIALLENDLAEPAGKRGRFPQLRQAEISLEESFLCRVLGQRQVPDQRVAVPHRHILKTPDEESEGFSVPITRSNH
jgi:hypothetical protein